MKDLDDTPELKQAWARYQLGGDALKGDISEFSHIDISSAVSAAIDDESIQLGGENSSKNWLKAFWRAFNSGIRDFCSGIRCTLQSTGGYK